MVRFVILKGIRKNSVVLNRDNGLIGDAIDISEGNIGRNSRVA